MALASEDALRLKVLLARNPQAIRIHESSMTLFGLTAEGEARLELHPDCRDEQYVKLVKEAISGHVLGSPGGYPVYLQRWTRMGQMRDANLDQMLLLAEPEAVVATVCAPGLSDELARRAWWAMEDAENARRMLHRDAVVNGEMGPVLATYLYEHLPFETEPEQMMETARLVLQPGLLTDAQIAELWKRGQRKPAYYVGFMAALPDAIPEPEASAASDDQLVELRGHTHAQLQLLARVLSGPGQAYLKTIQRVFKKPSNQEVVNQTLDIIADYFSPVRPEGKVDATLEELEADAERWLADTGGAVDGYCLDDQLRSARVLSGLSYGVVRPVFTGTTAIGSLMRRKLEPVMVPLLRHVEQLMRAA